MKKIFFSFCILWSNFVVADELKLESYKGKVIYLDFWASWCGPCKESFPWLNQLMKKHPELIVIGVNLDKQKSAAIEFLNENPALFRIVFNPEGSLAEAHQVKGMPYSIIFNRRGEKVFSHIGFNSDKATVYETEVKSLLELK